MLKVIIVEADFSCPSNLIKDYFEISNFDNISGFTMAIIFDLT